MGPAWTMDLRVVVTAQNLATRALRSAPPTLSDVLITAIVCPSYARKVKWSSGTAMMGKAMLGGGGS